MARDAELAPYMERPEAKKALGLTNSTIVTVAAAGVVRYVKGPEQSFPAGRFFFLREDVLKIRDAFEKHSVPVKEYSKPGELIALRHAVKNYLGHGAGLAASKLSLMVVLCRRDAQHVFEGSQATCSGPRISASTARPANEVQQFAARYVATSILAKQFDLDGGSLSRHL